MHASLLPLSLLAWRKTFKETVWAGCERREVFPTATAVGDVYL